MNQSQDLLTPRLHLLGDILEGIVRVVAKALEKKPGNVPNIYAVAIALERDFGFTYKIVLREGLRHFTKWNKEYYKRR